MPVHETMRVLSLQPELDPRAYKINKALTALYPDLEVYTLFGDERKVSEQISRSPFIKNFAPESYDLIFRKWNMPYGAFLKYYAPLSGVYGRVLAKRIENYARKNHIDIIHARPPPDHLGYVAKKHTEYPVVSEIYDLMSLADLDYKKTPHTMREDMLRLRTNRLADAMRGWEDYIAQNSDHLVFPYPGMKDVLEARYKIAPSTVVPNAIPRRERPTTFLPKLSEKDGASHLVCVGGIDIEPLEIAAYRAIMPQLVEMTEQGFHIHIYGTAPSASKVERIKDICNRNPRLHWHDPIPPPGLYEELTQYDAGLILVDPVGELKHIQISIPNKLFEYLSAGLYVFASKELWAIVDFLSEHGCGCGIERAGDISDYWGKHHPIPWKEEFSLEHYLVKLRKVYDSLV
ncbi:MAG: glycosyltransferase [Thermoplasmata archaeon]|nr:glycosyltransferase [Thermoplasmata archaeon]